MIIVHSSYIRMYRSSMNATVQNKEDWARTPILEPDYLLYRRVHEPEPWRWLGPDRFHARQLELHVVSCTDRPQNATMFSARREYAEVLVTSVQSTLDQLITLSPH